MTPKKGSGGKQPRRPPAWLEPFLANLRNTANVRAASEAAGIPRQDVYEYRDNHPEFAVAWRAALDEAIEMLEYEARRRALSASDTLLIFLLKSHAPDRYGDRLKINLDAEIARLAATTGLDADALRQRAQEIAESGGKIVPMRRTG